MDVVFSYAGYESMHDKMLDGFREAFRVLKSGGHTICTKATVEDHGCENSKKWTELLFSSLDHEEQQRWKNMLLDHKQWFQICRDTGFVENDSIKIYGELKAPDTEVFPFENEVAQWMAEYVFSSEKP